VLTIVLVFVAGYGTARQIGAGPLLGNREGMPPITGWAGRARRAHQNMLENLPLFAILVLAADAADVSNASTVLGAQMFFFARLAHAALYIAGIGPLRAVAWGVSLAGLALILVQLL
jgi:uncharacterized MAPEG superfamily protein